MALATSGIIKRFRYMAGKILRKIRKPKMTLEQLSEAVGISTSQLSRFETEERRPRVEEAIKIAKALNVKVADIFPEMADATRASLTEIDIDALLGAVRKSYLMLGLDEDGADGLLKIVLARAAGQKAPDIADVQDRLRKRSEAQES